MQLPNYMLEQRRWMVRPSNDAARAKLPQAAFDSCPDGYDGDPDKWRYAWANPVIWATLEQAFEYWGDNDDIAGLCYVLHPADDRGENLRLICLDFDGCFDEEGNLDPDVARFVEELGSYAEVSLSGRGLHVFVMICCEPFRNVLHFPIGNCKVDVLCSAQVAVTGDVWGENVALNAVSAEILERFPKKEVTDKGDDLPDFWTEENTGVRPDHEYLVPHMEEWNPCIEGQGGDKEMFKAACFLARHGATGWDAFNLLAQVEQMPPFDDYELQHKVESAWLSTHAENEFGIDGLGLFDDFPIDEDGNPVELTDEDEFGFTPVSLCDLAVMDLELSYSIDKLFVDKEGLFVGGREKCFKTGLAADLCLSLVTGEHFLGQFEVIEKKRVAFFTAEIGLRAAKALFGRIAKAKNVDMNSISELDVIDKLPSFQLDKQGKPADPMAIKKLKKYFEKRRPTVAVFDPLYLAMTGANVGDMYAIGGVLAAMDEVCRKYDVWPIYCHHARKDHTKEFQPMQLGDLYGSGVSAFARQWLLLAHAEPYADGRAALYAKVGGSAVGDAGLWRINIDEGFGDEIVERRWDVTVSTEAEHDTHESAREGILDALRYYGTLETVASIAMYADVDNSVAKKVLVELVKSGEAQMQNCKFIIST